MNPGGCWAWEYSRHLAHTRSTNSGHLQQAPLLTTSLDSCQEEVGLEETGAHRETPCQGFCSGLEEFEGCLFHNKRGCLSPPSHRFNKGGYSVSQKVKNPSRGHLCPIYHKSLSISAPAPPALISPLPFWLDRLNLPSAPSCPVPPLQEGHPAFLPSLPIIRTH